MRQKCVRRVALLQALFRLDSLIENGLVMAFSLGLSDVLYPLRIIQVESYSVA
jgi:hypothetical protein